MQFSAAQTHEAPSSRARRALQRVGFWVGLGLFVILLRSQPPASMIDAARMLAAERSALDGGHAPESSLPAADASAQRAIHDNARRMMAAAAVTALVAVWWISTAVPIPATSLMPVLLFPILGVMSPREAAEPYADPNVFLFMGGFIIALGIQRWDLHRRIALHVVAVIGTQRSTIVLGFMIASAFLSMWISNTATAMMMLPIALAVIASLSDLDETRDAPAKDASNFAVALMLGIAYATNVGGIATPIGTPPNIVFRGQLQKLVPGAPEIGFGRWMVMFLPLVVLFVPTVWFLLTRITCRFSSAGGAAGRVLVRAQLASLGPMTRPARAMLLVFALTALLWLTRSIPVSHDLDYGWAPFVESLFTPADGTLPRLRAANVSDATVALGMALLLFMIPAGRDDSGLPRRLMNWETARQLPWGILLLFGGGFSLAAGFESSGLSLWCGQLFARFDIHNPLLLIAGTCLLMTFLTEITSNTAATQVMLPIVARIGDALGASPSLLMLSATVSASCAFMLPVATPPNAIVFGSGHVSMGRMALTGLILNLAGVVLVTAVMYLVARPLLGL